MRLTLRGISHNWKLEKENHYPRSQKTRLHAIQDGNGSGVFDPVYFQALCFQTEIHATGKCIDSNLKKNHQKSGMATVKQL